MALDQPAEVADPQLADQGVPGRLDRRAQVLHRAQRGVRVGKRVEELADLLLRARVEAGERLFALAA